MMEAECMEQHNEDLEAISRTDGRFHICSDRRAQQEHEGNL